MKKVTTEEFIKRAKQIHGNKYDYSRTNYINAKTKVCIICPIHGEFWQNPFKHLGGQGCPKCKGDKISKAVRLTTQEFIKKAQEVHGNKYDYSKVKYTNSSAKICIICPIHGEFWQQPRAHLQGSGCALCMREKNNALQTKTTEQFIKEAKKVHGDKYDYSKVNYVGCFEKVCIICPKHGEFWQTPDNHIHGHGCRKCLFEKVGDINKLNTEEFIARAKQVHGDKYDYSKVNYVGCDKKVKIICPTHGEFEQTPYNHLHSRGCPYCRNWKLEEDIAKFLQDNNIDFERQKRFEWLGKQSLDLYLPLYKVAIECQGEQHFKPIKYFGGIKRFEYRVKMDAQKKRLCNKNGIKIIYYSYKAFDENIITQKDIILKEIKKGIIK